MSDTDIVNRLFTLSSGLMPIAEATAMRDAADAIERLRAERDEARRRLCIEWTEHGPVRLNKEQIAMRYGWDCFKENTND